MDPLTLKGHNSFEKKTIIEKPRTILLPDLLFLCCDKKFEKSLDICVT